jgi:hypothetical protein
VACRRALRGFFAGLGGPACRALCADISLVGGNRTVVRLARATHAVLFLKTQEQNPMITDTFIEELRLAFATFGVDEPVERTDDYVVMAGEVEIEAYSSTSDLPTMLCVYTNTDCCIDIPLSMPRTAIIAAVEWHLNNPRQLSLEV